MRNIFCIRNLFMTRDYHHHCHCNDHCCSCAGGANTSALFAASRLELGAILVNVAYVCTRIPEILKDLRRRGRMEEKSC